MTDVTTNTPRAGESLWQRFTRTEGFRRGFDSLTGIRDGWRRFVDSFDKEVFARFEGDPHYFHEPDFTFEFGQWFESSEAVKKSHKALSPEERNRAQMMLDEHNGVSRNEVWTKLQDYRMRFGIHSAVAMLKTKFNCEGGILSVRLEDFAAVIKAVDDALQDDDTLKREVEERRAKFFGELPDAVREDLTTMPDYSDKAGVTTVGYGDDFATSRAEGMESKERPAFGAPMSKRLRIARNMALNSGVPRSRIQELFNTHETQDRLIAALLDSVDDAASIMTFKIAPQELSPELEEALRRSDASGMTTLETVLEDAGGLDPGWKDSNPKDGIGVTKPPLTVMSQAVIMAASLGMLEGALKYGRHNYRAVGVRASVYVDATMRHLIKFWEFGEDIDTESKAALHHIDKAISSLSVLSDSIKCGNLKDDRPEPHSLELWASYEKATKELLAAFPEPVAPYLAGGLRGPGRIL